MHTAHMDVTEITVLNGRVRLRHPAQGGLRASLDSVMLAAACPILPGQSLLDMGCGVGSAGLCVLARVPDVKLTGIEILPAHAALAHDNAGLNGWDAQARFLASDIRDYASGLSKPLFDHVICNPPYLEAGTYDPSPNADRASALGHQDPDITLADWVKAAHRALKSKGSLTMIHRADALPRLINALGRMFGDIAIIPLWPRTGQPAKRVIIRAWKDRHGPATLHPGLILHDADGGYTPEAEGVLRGAEALNVCNASKHA